MKPFSILVAGIAFACAVPGSPVTAQENPFTNTTTAARHHVLTFETYRLSQEALDALHDRDLSSKTLFEGVRELVTKGTASLETVMAVAATPKQRASCESADELNFPCAWDPPTVGQPFAFPTCYEMRSLGERIEIETDAESDLGPVQLSVAPEFTRLRGFTLQVADRSADADVQPLFASRTINTRVMCPLDAPVLLGTMSPPAHTGLAEADGDGTVSLAFVRVRPAESQPPGDPASGKAVISSGKNLRLVFRCYSLPRAAARDLLAATIDGDKLLQLVRESPAGAAKLERLLSMAVGGGYRSTYEEKGERLYGTELDPPSLPVLYENSTTAVAAPAGGEGAGTQPADPKPKLAREAGLLPAWFTAHETRPLGWRFEVEPTVLPGGRYVKLMVAPQRTEFRGMVKGHPLLEKYPEQPLFATQKLTTEVTAAVGRQCFLGTMSPPQDSGVNGREADGRTWLAFLKVTLE